MPRRFLGHVSEHTLEARAVAACTGAFVADAASLWADGYVTRILLCVRVLASDRNVPITASHLISCSLSSPSEVAAAVVREGSAVFLPPQTPRPSHGSHSSHVPGNPSHHGETLAVLLRSLTANVDGNRGSNPSTATFAAPRGLHAPSFLRAFSNAFGSTGSFVGFTDSVTRAIIGTLLTQEEVHKRIITPASAVISDEALRAAAREQLVPLVERVEHDDVPAAAAALAGSVAPSAPPYDVAAFVSLASALADSFATWVGAGGRETVGLALLPALVARYAGHADLPHLMSKGVRVVQTHEDAQVWLLWAARVLEAVILGVPPRAAVVSCLVRLEQPFRAAVEAAVHAADADAAAAAAAATGEGAATPQQLHARLLDVTARLGTTGDLSKALPCAVYLVLRHGNSATVDTFTAAVTDNVLAGGDACGRALFIGGILGAAAATVPAALLAQVAEPLRLELAELTSHIHVPVDGPSVEEGHIFAQRVPHAAAPA